MSRLPGERLRRAYLLSDGTGRRPGYRGFWVEWLEPAEEPRAGSPCHAGRVAASPLPDGRGSDQTRAGSPCHAEAPATYVRLRAWRKRRVRLDTRDEARAFAARKSAELNAALHGRLTWRDMTERFADGLAVKHLHTQAKYLETLKLFAERCGRPMAHEITPELCNRFIARLAEESIAARRAAGAVNDVGAARRAADGAAGDAREGAARRRAPATVHKHARHLRIFTRFGMEQSPPWFAADPARRLSLPTRPRRLVRAPATADAASLLNATGKTPDPLGWYLAVLFAICTGLRREDVLALRWTDLAYEPHPDDGAMRLVIVATAAKKLRENLWIAPPRLEAAIEARREAGAAEEVRRRAGRPSPARDGRCVIGWPRWPKRQWDRLARESGWAYTFHDLRSYAATVLRRSAVAGLLAGQHLGHTSARVAELHYSDRFRQAALLADLIAREPLPSWAECHASATATPRPPARSSARAPAP